MNSRCLRVFAVVGLLAGQGFAPALASASESPGPTNLIVAYRIEGRPDKVDAATLQDNPKVEAYPILVITFITSASQIERLNTLVAAEHKRAHNPSVCFYPGLALGFVDRAGVTNVFVCLECRNLSGSKPDQLVGMSDEAFEEFSSLYTKLFASGKRGDAR